MLASAIDTGQLAALAKPTMVEQRRVAGLKLHDDRVIRLLEAVLHPGGFVANWTTRDLHSRIRFAESDDRLSQRRYDLAKLRAKGLVERLGRTRCCRLTSLGLKLGVLLVKLRIRLLGPLVSVATTARHPTRNDNSVEAAFHEVDTALDHLSVALGLKPAA